MTKNPYRKFIKTICVYPRCSNKARRRGRCLRHKSYGNFAITNSRATASPVETVLAADRDRMKQTREIIDLRERYKASLKDNERLEGELRATAVLHDNVDITRIEPRYGGGTSEATPVILASDWHVEETVRGPDVSGLNVYNPEIAQKRVTKFFQGALRLTSLLNQDVKINTIILGLLGDYITNDIHGEESAEANALLPTHAIVTAQNMIISGLEFLLDHSKYNFLLICKVGNHSRTTKTSRFTNENGHSLEYLMYLHLVAYFRNEPRISFQVDDGYHSYIDVYDTTIRFHHGHEIKYGGGVGGIFVPTYKAIAQWNKARHTNLDVFGHFHQTKDGGNFLCNGSGIGYNAFAMSIKADYEPPMQTLFLIDKKRGRTCTWPIMISEGRR